MPNNWPVLDTRSGGGCVVLADVPEVLARAVWWAKQGRARRYGPEYVRLGTFLNLSDLIGD